MGDTEAVSPFWRSLLERVAFPLLVIATVALAGGLYALRRDLDRLDWAIARVQQDSAEHAAVFERFRAPGDRFTASDGARLDTRLTKVERECEQCALSRAEVLLRLQGLEREQDRLCQRILPCDHGAPAAPRSQRSP